MPTTISQPLATEREQALHHLHLVAAYPGYWELRSLRRAGLSTRLEPRGSRFFHVIATANNLLFDGIEQAADWACEQAAEGSEVFVSASPRSTPGGKQARDVTTVTASFVDIDVAPNHDRENALNGLLQAEPAPSLIIDSGGGYHALWLLEAPDDNLHLWRAVQRGVVQRFSAVGADPVPALDRARVLRLVPFANRKYVDPRSTAILRESEHRYTLSALAGAFAPNADEPAPEVGIDDAASDAGEPAPYGLFADHSLTADQLQAMVDSTVATRHVLRSFVLTYMKPGVHFGIIPGYDGKPASKPTLLKAGAELIAILLGLNASFSPDTATIAMYGPATSGVFAYVCVLRDRTGMPVGEGRGVTELREPTMSNSPNVAAKMAQKRAYVDAVLRTAGLSNFFTQDLEEPLPPPPPDPTPSSEPPAQPLSPVICRVPATLAQVRSIRSLLQQSGQDERSILTKLQISSLQQLSEHRAAKVLARLQELVTRHPQSFSGSGS